MDPLVKVMALLPWVDWAAIAVFFCGWAGYAWFARHRASTTASSTACGAIIIRSAS